jgi:class 3 adenylate cyclase/tetratricopeptide (TPR) repeat protein
MNCPQCDFDSPPGMKFCGRCGARLASTCPHCGTEIPPGFKFCGECGQPLAPAEPATAAKPPPPPASPEPEQTPSVLPAAPRSYTPAYLTEKILQSRTALEGERKQVTVLFCDLVGSTALAERVGPETMHLLLNQFFELALREVHRYEGTINQFLGDGFMALFGAPITHEDHPRRAALAALGLRKGLEERRAELGDVYGVELKVRMGLNTGWVVVGGIGDQLRRDYTAIGDTTNLAARLQQIAEPGAILVSEATSRFLQGVQMKALEPFQVKGKTAPVQAYQLVGAGSVQSEEAVLGAMSRSPFVGRQREMAILEELLERAEGGEGQVLGIAAEAGSGKSRLLYELRRRLWNRPTRWLAGRCLSYGSVTPYLPLLYMLRNEWGIGDTDDSALVAEKVTEGLGKAGIEAGEALPYFLRLLGEEDGTADLSELSPQALQARTFGRLRQLLLNAGQGRLVILEIEDLHWIDETSEDFLAYLVEGLMAARMLLLLTYRPGYRPRWIEKSYATQISLSRLTDPESQTVMRAVLRRAELPEHLLSVILTRAEGNPFFLEELTRSLVERPDVAVPDTIQGVLMARIDRLPEDHKRLLQTASILGREFPLPLLTAIWQPGEDPLPLLSDLKRWEFLYEEPGTGEPRYFFKHALTQEAVYQTLLTSRRQSLHAAAGQAFERLYAGRLEDVYDRLAYHFSKTDNSEKAVLYLSLFAQEAARGYAHAEAAQALREALRHAERLPETERDRRSVELILQLAPSLLPLVRFSETLEVFSHHREALERLGDASLAGRYFFWLAHTHSYLGDQGEAESAARQAIASAQAAGDVTTEGLARYVLSRDAFWSGRFSEGIEHGRQAVALLEQGKDRWWQGQAYWVAGFHHYVLGQLKEAFAMMDRAAETWRALQDPRLDPSWSTGYFHASLGDWDIGIKECQEGLERAQDPLNTAAALGFLGYAYLEKGDLARAIGALEDSVGRLRQAGMQQLLGWFSAFLAEAYLLSDRAAEAAKLAEEALAVTEGVRFRYGSGMAQRALGKIARATGDPLQAKKQLDEALESFNAIGAPFEVGRTRLDLALAAGAGSGEAAWQLGEARRLFAELELPHYVEKTDSLAAELAGTASLERSSGPNAR